MSVTFSSPAYQQMCVALGTMSGGAVGALASGIGVAAATPMMPILLSAAVGLLVTKHICSTEPFDKAFKDLFDFESAIESASLSSSAQGLIADKLVADGIASDPATGRMMVIYALRAAAKDSPRYFNILRNEGRGSPTPMARHGLTLLAHAAGGVKNA